MNRRLLDPAIMDMTTWPQLCFDLLPPEKVVIARRWSDAIKLYLAGKPHAVIQAITGLDRRRVSRLISRALMLHQDGRIFGFRACLPFIRVKWDYDRTAPSPAIDKRAAFGHAGLTLRLLKRFPHIKELVCALAFAPGSGVFTESVQRGDKIHRAFIEECVKAKIPQCEYPFNVENKGTTGLERILKRELRLRNLRRSVNAAFGEEAARKLGSSWSAIRTGARLLCYERVEFDGYRIDCICTLEIPDPVGGLPVYLPLERIWLLVVVEVTSRAVLGYHVCFGRHYSAEDVLTCFENAIIPWKPRVLATRGLSFSPAGGVPSGVIPELAYAKWGEVAIDNDRSNCAPWVSDRIRDKIGCVINPGPFKSPERRLFVERFFLELAKNGFQRLPTTTGSRPTDPKRRDPEAVAQRYHFTLDEVLDLIDVIVANYNGLTTTAKYNRSPLDYLRTAVAQNAFFIRHIPEPARQDFTLTLKRVNRTVRGNLRKGVRPYIGFEGVRYYSERLGNSPALLGRKIVVECNTRDLRTLRLYLPTGEEIDKITASQAWAYHAHDLRTRKAILRCIRLGKLSRRDAADPVGNFIKLKAAESLTAKKPRNEMAHVVRVKNSGRTAPAPARPPAAPPEGSPMRRYSAPRLTILLRSPNF